MLRMAARIALAALIALGLAIVSLATLHVVPAERLAWNVASWLIGLALVLAVARRGGAPSDELPHSEM